MDMLSTINEDDENVGELSPIRSPTMRRGRRESTLLKPTGAFETRVTPERRERI
jgi:hypothetical protein